MFISYSLFYMFSSFAILSSLFVITTRNPVFSVLFLISAFANVSCILFLFQFEFLPVAFLVVYVGAIAVLFLFVLMMLNIKLAELQNSFSNFLPISIFFFFVFLIEILFIFRSEFTFLSNFNEESTLFLCDFLNNYEKFNFINLSGLNTNLKAISVALFTDYLYPFLIASYVLLLAMVAAITLTLYKTFVSKTQNIYKQIMTDYDKVIVNYA